VTSPEKPRKPKALDKNPKPLKSANSTQNLQINKISQTCKMGKSP
jgi:hypothetical protein